MWLFLACYVPTYGPLLVDADGDGFLSAEDCDDDDADVFPGSHATEVPGDGVDVDCDGIDACVDLSCDGRADLVMALLCSLPDETDCRGDFSYQSEIFFGRDGEPQDIRNIATDNPRALAVGDFDADGYPDLVIGSGPTTRIGPSAIYWGGPDGPDDGDRTLLELEDPTSLAAADLDDDGADELIVGQRGVPARLLWGDSSRKLPEAALTAWQASGVAVADLDADGALDVLLAGTESAIVWGEGARAGLEAASPISAGVGTAAGVSAADLDCDGELEVVFSRDFDAAGFVASYALILGSNGPRSYASVLELYSPGAVGAVIADFDHDSRPDVAFANRYVGTGTSVSESDEGYIYFGPLAEDSAFILRQAFGLVGAAAGDLNNDGWTDLVYAAAGGVGSPIYYGGPRAGLPVEIAGQAASAALLFPPAPAGCPS